MNLRPRATSWTLFERAPLIALAISLALAWFNFAGTVRWAALPGSLHGWRRPWYALALLAATVLTVIYRRRVGQPVRAGTLAPVAFLVVGAVVLVTCLFSRLPLSTWSQIPFDDDWTPLFQAAVDGVRRLERGVVMGWNWSFLGGYPTSTDIAQSFALHAFLPMEVFGDRVGFHVLHAIWIFSIPLFVWWDLRQEDRAAAAVAGAFACFLVAGYSMTLGKSGDVNSLAGVFSASLAMVGSRAARLGRRWGGAALLLGLTLALYSHVAFFVYAAIYLALEAAYFRDRGAAVRLFVSGALAVVASLPVHWESLRYPAYVSFNNVTYSPGAPTDWAHVIRTIYYNVEFLALPHRWFNHQSSLPNIWLPVVLVVAIQSRRSRTGFYAWALLVTVGLQRLNTPEFGAGFDRIMHMMPLVAAPALAGFVLQFAGTRALAMAIATVVALFTAMTFAPVPHVSDVRAFNPALIDRLAALDGNMVVVEISPHRDMDSDPDRHAPRASWDVHFEGLLPGVAGQRFYAQMWDGWMFNSWRGQVVGAGTYRGRRLSNTPIDAFVAEMRRWGVRHLLVWTDESRAYLASGSQFAERWRQAPWSDFELLDADVRSVVPASGQGTLTDLDPLAARVRLSDVTEGSRVVVRANYYPAWQAHAGDRQVPLYSQDGQLAFDAPASGSYVVELAYPPRRGLSTVALGALVLGMFLLARWPQPAASRPQSLRTQEIG